MAKHGPASDILQNLDDGVPVKLIFDIPVSDTAYLADPSTIENPSQMTVIIDPGAPDGKSLIVAIPHVWNGHGITAGLHAGYRFNGASVPRLARPLIDRLELGVKAAGYHDAFYEGTGLIKPEHGWQTGGRLRRYPEVEHIFRTMMLEDGVPRTKAIWAYRATRHFGGSTWERYRDGNS
jgi:hypothetical protein